MNQARRLAYAASSVLASALVLLAVSLIGPAEARADPMSCNGQRDALCNTFEACAGIGVRRCTTYYYYYTGY